MQPIIRRQILIGIEVIPSFLFRVPDHVKALQPTRFGFEQILLKRGDAHDGMHRVFGCDPVLFGDGCAIFIPIGAELDAHAIMAEGCAIEISDHRVRRWRGPGQRMMRTAPRAGSLGMALSAL
ncbi:hypothetical protein [Ruegeria sp. HKCCD8929]|uniref:hypothetical protein n=1 Tax=Ruegeria sp. HKCCD8929 TaxID=2683006 RepID=UPI00353031E1